MFAVAYFAVILYLGLSGPTLVTASGVHSGLTLSALAFATYFPAGLLVVLSLWRRLGIPAALALAAILGGGLPLLVQMFQPLPGTSPLATAAGAFAGGAVAVAAGAAPWFAKKSAIVRERWLLPGGLSEIGLVVLFLALLVQLNPLFPSLGPGKLEYSIMSLWQAFFDAPYPDPYRAGIYALTIAAFGTAAMLLSRSGRRGLVLFAWLLATAFAVQMAVAILLLKVTLSWRLSINAATGVCLGMLLLALLAGARRSLHKYLFIAFLLAVIVIGPGYSPWPVRPWYQSLSQIDAWGRLVQFLRYGLPLFLLGTVVNLATPFVRRAAVASAGAGAAVLLALGLQWAHSGPGIGYGAVLLAPGMWLLAWLWHPDAHAVKTLEGVAGEGGETRRGLAHWFRGRRVAAVLAISGVLIAGGVILGKPVEIPLDEAKMYRLPDPAALLPVSLPNFRYSHPRLPVPTPADIARLENENPSYLNLRRYLAKNRGDIYSTVLLEKAYPGTQDLAGLYKRLMKLKFSYRGNQQGLPLAMAYDWLYDEWTEAQRTALRGKLAEGCEYITEIIRNDRLSPYNVYLYNSPFQALMAMALVLYGDDARGEIPMRFTYDMWKNRILPVWRQVMGKNGGWHEGGEYVGIGIGQAIYRLPAMWHAATGENLFPKEPGIRGFLDFLVYRTRPDGTCFRWGDARFFDRQIPDRLALALEYRDAAAYSLGPPPPLQPTSWPWGPLTDRMLYDPQAIARLPLTKYLDGIGMVIARSGWGPDATYVTFKAGDNYWSHSHLDQGAFTVYKGGALAIDSGFYGPYGTDHHMNYTYQTIAHNTITVTDPNDTVPVLRGIDNERHIANDGGQRRIGSGWGVEPAPLDRAEWKAKKETYHTGKIESLMMQDGITVAVADITPAYTNAYSGKGMFSARTRRVERFWRIFGYDRIDDVIVIFDQVVATHPEFRKRWLLHTIERPIVTRNGFTVTVSPANRIGHGGGRLEGHVLLPRNATINLVGGRGFEFYVDGKNYDENGKLLRRILNPGLAEPGAWRIEVEPGQESKEDNFLVVLSPSVLGQKTAHRVKLINEGKRTGCEIVGPHRTTRWWFEPGKNSVTVAVSEGGVSRKYTVSPWNPLIAEVNPDGRSP